MPLRAKVLWLFLLLAAFPLLTLGIVQYVQSLNAVERLIADQNGRIADRVAESIQVKAALLESDLLMLSENAETQRWLQEGNDDRQSEEQGRTYLNAAWTRLSSGYAGMALADAQGRQVFTAGSDEAPSGRWRTLSSIDRPVLHLSSGQQIGVVSLQPILEAIIPLGVISSGFGDLGVGMVVDPAADRVLYHSDANEQSRTIAEVLGAGFTPSKLDGSRGTFTYSAAGVTRVASWTSVGALPWIVVMSGAVSEFAAPFADSGRSTLLLFIAVALIATLVFTLSLRRTTRSLEELMIATADVAQGDFSPKLPPAGRDEVGRLSESFGAMAQRVGQMMEEVKTSRQMAVLGKFAAQLSHEIRNPLTSIKLNLQKIEREVQKVPAARATATPLGIALREVHRLDDVVRGVLGLARQVDDVKQLGSAHALVLEAVEVIAEQAERQGVTIEMGLEAPNDQVVLEASRIKGAVLNLLLNALEAMPAGGRLRVSSGNSQGMVEITVSDTGPGIPADQRTTVFQPFATTRPGGTGLGLPLARRAVEDHGGSLELGPSTAGACLVIRLPLPDA